MCKNLLFIKVFLLLLANAILFISICIDLYIVFVIGLLFILFSVFANYINGFLEKNFNSFTITLNIIYDILLLASLPLVTYKMITIHVMPYLYVYFALMIFFIIISVLSILVSFIRFINSKGNELNEEY